MDHKAVYQRLADAAASAPGTMDIEQTVRDLITQLRIPREPYAYVADTEAIEERLRVEGPYVPRDDGVIPE